MTTPRKERCPACGVRSLTLAEATPATVEGGGEPASEVRSTYVCESCGKRIQHHREAPKAKPAAVAEPENEFAHGFYYGDYFGVVFHGPPTRGHWLDRLAVSDVYIDPLFLALLYRYWNDSTDATPLPRLAMDWNVHTGWGATAAGRTSIPPDVVREFVHALDALLPEDLAPHVAGCSVEDCLRCAVVVVEFLNRRLANGRELYIEDD